MASRAKTTTTPPVLSQTQRQVAGLLLIALTVLLASSFFSYRPNDVPIIQNPPNRPTVNIIGLVGAWTSYISFMVLGLAAYLLPVITGVQCVLCFLGNDIRPGMKLSHKLGWMSLLLLCVACALELLSAPAAGLLVTLNIPYAGGALGHLVGSLFLFKLLGDIGAGVLIVILVLIALVCLFDFDLRSLFRDPRNAWSPLWRRLKGWMVPDAPEESLDLEEDPIAELPPPRRRRPAKPEAIPEPIPLPVVISPPQPVLPEPILDFEEEPDLPISIPQPLTEPEPPRIVSQTPAPADSIFKTTSPASTSPAPKVLPVSDDDSLPIVDVDGIPQFVWTLPPINLLAAPVGDHGTSVSDGTREAYLRQLLETTLKEFGVEARITDVQRGPVVTSFEVLPAPGVRVEKIASLSNNLALALKAETIRVQAPIPGKGVVGIEVPNGKSTVVFAREIIESAEWAKAKDWRKSKISLPMCLGVDVSGNKVVGDLADMPHVLIAGATGSGKSVCMNSLLAGLLMSRTPDQMRLILVDPKIVEFTAYRDLPHLVVPVITDPKRVGLGLRWAITEMEKRYKLFAKHGVRNIKGFNNRVIAKQGDLFGVEDDEEEERVPDTLPYIVIVIDELADLMMVAQAEVENYIARLAQLSRAVGIHMILATQRPSVNVITGTIKANFPARIAFQVAQKTDSRTILDAIGADKLLGKGDMLYLSPSSSKLLRAQGAWTSDEEINHIVDHYKNQGTPTYEHKVAEKIATSTPDLPDQEEDDDLVNQAIEVIRQTRRASTSALQRRLRIGYNRAARLMDQLEEKGVIGPPQGSDPREILIDLDNGQGTPPPETPALEEEIAE